MPENLHIPSRHIQHSRPFETHKQECYINRPCTRGASTWWGREWRLTMIWKIQQSWSWHSMWLGLTIVNPDCQKTLPMPPDKSRSQVDRITLLSCQWTPSDNQNTPKKLKIACHTCTQFSWNPQFLMLGMTKNAMPLQFSLRSTV